MKVKFFKTNGEAFELQDGGRVIVYDDDGDALMVFGQDTADHIWVLDGGDIAFKEEVRAIDSGVRPVKVITQEID